jgi:pimeloyl-ACP methyl ester carboxylesterase
MICQIRSRYVPSTLSKSDTFLLDGFVAGSMVDGDSLPVGFHDTAVSSNTVTAAGHSVRYLTAGSGPPLVLLHGGIIDAAGISWGELIEPLAEDASVYALDLLGYGESELPPGPLSMTRHVDTVAAVLDELDLDDPVVAGLSMGGGVAVGLGLSAPEQVGALVPIDAFALGSELSSGLLTWLLAKIQVTNNVSVALTARSRRFAEASLASLAFDADSISPVTVDRVMEEARRPNAGKAFRKFRASEVTRDGYRTNYADDVATLDVPTHFVHGADDDLLPPAWSRRAAERTPGAELSILDDCGHLTTLERPESVRAIIREML